MARRRHDPLAEAADAAHAAERELYLQTIEAQATKIERLTRDRDKAVAYAERLQRDVRLLQDRLTETENLRTSYAVEHLTAQVARLADEAAVAQARVAELEAAR